jgi:hypothetical protein
MGSLEVHKFKHPARVKQIPPGSIFGQWTTISDVFPRLVDYPGRPGKLAGQVKVRCSCGNEEYVLAKSLRSGKSTRCRRCMNWKGVDAGYAAKHIRVKNLKGKADSCIWGCDSELYDWACVTGNYDDPDDYVAMCRLCHNRFDIEVKRFIMNTSTDPLVREMTRQSEYRIANGLRNKELRQRKRQDDIIGAP